MSAGDTTTTDATVSCTCDACGKPARADVNDSAPTGWFFVNILDPDDQGIVAVIIACSEACKVLPWKKQKGDRS